MIPVTEWDAASYERKFSNTYAWIAEIKPEGVYGKPELVYVSSIGNADTGLVVASVKPTGPEALRYFMVGSGGNPYSWYKEQYKTIPLHTFMYHPIEAGVFKLPDSNRVYSRHRLIDKAYKTGADKTLWLNEQLSNGDLIHPWDAFVLGVKQPSRFAIQGDRVFYMNISVGIVFKKENVISVDNPRLQRLLEKEFPEWKVKA